MRASKSPLIGTRADLIAFAARLDGVDTVAFDTEFHAEETYWPKVMLLQFATPSEVALVDPLAPEVKASLGGFLELFRMRSQTLVGHALDRDLEIFLRLNGGLPARVFDTQIAAGLLGHGGPISLAGLLQARLGLDIEKLYTQSDWGKRPLPEGQIAYAMDDVRHLLPLAASLREALVVEGREAWAMEENARLLDPKAYLPTDPADAWRRVGRKPTLGRPRAVLEALAAERERIARETDRPPRRVLPDDVIVDLARRAPTDAATLESDTRRRPAPNVERYASRWLEAIRAGLEAPSAELSAGGGESLAPSIRAAMELGRVLAHWTLERHGVAPWLVPSLEDGLRALVLAPPTSDRETFQSRLGLSGWRAGLLVEPLWQLFVERQAVRVDVGPSGLEAAFGR